MTSSDLILYIVIGAIVESIILFYIISYAVNASKMKKYKEIEINLLMKIAKAQGVPADELNKIIGL